MLRDTGLQHLILFVCELVNPERLFRMVPIQMREEREQGLAFEAQRKAAVRFILSDDEGNIIIMVNSEQHKEARI